MKKATFGGGCFWCIEACMQQLRGVYEILPGYSGGVLPHPTYKELCKDNTGHAEVVQIKYNPNEISYRSQSILHYLATHISSL